VFPLSDGEIPLSDGESGHHGGALQRRARAARPQRRRLGLQCCSVPLYRDACIWACKCTCIYNL
jgi:hypothetical protein